jgi:hypothetical protein
VKAWRQWATKDAPLAVTGRITDFGMLRALVLASQRVGWDLSLEESSILAVKNLANDLERFPALLFRANNKQNGQCTLDDVASLYLNG